MRNCQNSMQVSLTMYSLCSEHRWLSKLGMAVDPQAPNGKNEEGMFLIVVLVCNYRMSFTVSEGPNFCQIFPFFQIVTLGLSAY